MTIAVDLGCKATKPTNHLMTQIIYKFFSWDENPPAVRMRPEAEDIADKNSQVMMGNLMRGEVDPPTVRDTKLPKHMQVTETP